MKTFAFAMLAVFSANALGAQPSGPERVVAAFYESKKYGEFGTDKYTLGPVRQLLTNELDALMSATDVYQNACRKPVPPNTKPWILDGTPWFYHSADGAKSMDGTKLLSQTSTTARVSANLSYDEYKWTDTVLLIKVNGAWRIADIRFQQGGGLINSLRGFIRRSCGRV